MLQSWMHTIHAINGVMNSLSIGNALIIVTIGSEFRSGRIPTPFTLGTMLAWDGFVMIARCTFCGPITTALSW